MLLLKVLCIPGLESIVREELQAYPEAVLIEETKGALYLSYTEHYATFFSLRSCTDIYLVKRDSTLTPLFLSRHKSELGTLIETAKTYATSSYKTFSLSCAGSHSPEVTSIEEFIIEKYRLRKSEEADMKISIGKYGTQWEVGVSLTIRPLSLRSYKIEHMKGALNPTIAYAMNTLCELVTRNSYLNIFSGSGTLLIEAAQTNPKLRLVGIDNNPKHNTLAIQNIKKAGFIENIKLTAGDIYNAPELGFFDVITSDLPFGMSIAKGEDLSALYEAFLRYSERSLTKDGVLVAYTSEYELLRTLLLASKFTIVKNIALTLSTSANAYLHPQIFVCTLRH